MDEIVNAVGDAIRDLNEGLIVCDGHGRHIRGCSMMIVSDAHRRMFNFIILTVLCLVVEN